MDVGNVEDSPTDGGAHDGGEEEGVGPVGEATDGRTYDGVEVALAECRGRMVQPTAAERLRGEQVPSLTRLGVAWGSKVRVFRATGK